VKDIKGRGSNHDVTWGDPLGTRSTAADEIRTRP